MLREFMKNSLLLFVLLVGMFTTSYSQAEKITSALPLYSKIYDEKRDPFADAKAAIALAQSSNRNVLIEIGGNWCTWCHKIDAFLEKNPEIYQSLHSKFVLLKISVSDTNENEAFMRSLPPVLGYPHMYVSTNTGQMLLSKDTAELLDGLQYSKIYWTEFLDKWQAKNNKEHG
jgi:thioredoxin-related protein